MIEDLYIWVSSAMEKAPVLALSAAFVWGIISVIASPCHLASLPLIVGFISGQGKMSRTKALGTSSLFALGILITIALLGVITGVMGRMWGDIGATGNYIVAGLFLLVGLNLLGVIPMPYSASGNTGMKRKGPAAAFLLGLIFGIALGPCTFGFMAPVLEASFRLAKSNLIYAVMLTAVYGLGHCAVIALAGASTGAVQQYLNWNEKSRGATILRRICGVLVIMGGAFLIYNTASGWR